MLDFLFSLYNHVDWALLGLRLAVGAIFLAHGISKWPMWKMQPSAEMPKGMLMTMRLLSVAEPLGGAAVLLGLLTQFAAAGLGIIMLGALYLKITKWHAKFTGNNGWELDLLLLAANFLLFMMGAGTWSLDNFLAL
jgi:putative oxidoreductase